MDNGHLTDDQIQEILDARVLHSGPVVPLHLGTCARCRGRLESFRRLYAGLDADPGFVLPAAFADDVLAKIPAPPPLLWQRPAVKIALASSAGAALLAGLLIFVDMRPLANGALQVLAALKRSLLPLAGQGRQLLAWLGGNARPFLVGGLGLLGASLADHLLRRQLLHRPR
jgi:hypothetical protein